MNRNLLLLTSACLAGAVAQPALADTYTFNAQYFTHNATGDFEQYIDGAWTNLLQSTLGPNGLPVLNLVHPGGAITELNANNEILWWTPNGTSVLANGSGTITSPFVDDSFYPSQGAGSNDSGLFQTAIFSGVISLASASTVTFTFGGDDDVFLFVDGQSVGQLGGVHGYTQATPTTGSLGAGDHQFTLFYADRHTVGAQLHFSIDTEGLTVTPGVPEPASWAMMIAGFGLLGMTMRRRRTAVSFA